MAHTIRPFILCGGSGTRLWPLSTPARPKPFMALGGDGSMLAETAARLEGEIEGARFAPLTAIGALRHETLLRQHLPGAGLILEPTARDSAPAVACAALASVADDLVLILAADHHIARPERFLQAIAQAAPAAHAGRIVTFGIKPDHAATGYGYIKAGESDGPVHPVEAFVEKPGRQTARNYLASGDYLWNAGIFLFRADIMIGELETHAPDILAAVRDALPVIGPRVPGAITRLDPAAFARSPSNSIDYAVMEKTARMSVAPVDMGWSDVGDHAALHRLTGGEGLVAEGPVITRDVRRGFVRSEGPLVAVQGVDGLAVIATRDAVLVTPLDRAADLKPLVKAAEHVGPLAQMGQPDQDWARDWLFERCLPLWAGAAWDKDKGGFVESLTLDGEPQPELARRMRVIPRQVFAFSEAARIGWLEADAARALVMDGLDYLDGPARSAEGGWVHRLDPDGGHLDPRRGLYDHAFIVLAGAAAWRAFKEDGARRIAFEALDVIHHLMSDARGGFYDPELEPSRRLANPHMHLLEASLALYEATGSGDALDVAGRCVLLLEEHFFHHPGGAVLETLNADWSRPGGAQRVEPGHCYEWAYLLGEYERIAGRDLASWRRRLIAFADAHGRHPGTGFAVNAIQTHGGALDPHRRLWPQLEMFRARIHYPDTAPPGAAARLLARLRTSYLSGACEGGWMDEYDAEGRPAARSIPASMLYHVMTALGPLAEA